MGDAIEKQKGTYIDAFINCSKLYSFYRSQDLHVRRAVLHGREVEALPIDYCCDFDLKIRRALGFTPEYDMTLRLLCSETEGYTKVPSETQLKLGKTFKAFGLDETGSAYRHLFFLASRAYDRAQLAKEAATKDAELLLGESTDGTAASDDLLGKNGDMAEA